MEAYIARQPIYSADKTLAAFELLYRESDNNIYSTSLDGNQSTRVVISDALFMFDMDTLTQGKMAFVNFTRDLILQEIPLLLTPQNFAIEILEDIELDAPLVGRLKELKRAGFTLVLDDYIGDPIPADALALIDIIKVDFLQTDRDTRRSIAQNLLKHGKKLLAEKIETEDEYKQAAHSGYELFQGYYFSRPVVLKKNRKDIASSTYMKLLKEVHSEDLNYKKMADIIYTDAHLTYQLLKKMRKAQYYRRHNVSSIGMALARMGVNEVRRWITLLLLHHITGDGMDELIKTGLIRAVFCECLAEKLLPGSGDAAFGMGMFSIISSEDESFISILDNLHLSDSLREALNGNDLLGNILNLVELYEKGRWNDLEILLDASFPSLLFSDLSPMYLAAVNYADIALVADEE